MLLGVETDDERGDVDNLLANTDVALADEDTGVVDGLGEAELVDASLKAALHEILDLQGKDVIELHAGLVEHTDTHETANEGIAFEQTLRVLLVEGKKLTVVAFGLVVFTDRGIVVSQLHPRSNWEHIWMHIPGSTTNLGEGELDTPHLTLVAQTVLSNELQLGVTIVRTESVF